MRATSQLIIVSVHADTLGLGAPSSAQTMINSGRGEWAPVEMLVAADGLRVPPSVDLAAIVIGALTGGLLAAREGFAVSGVLLLAVSGGLGGGLIRDVLLAQRADIVSPAPTTPSPR